MRRPTASKSLSVTASASSSAAVIPELPGAGRRRRRDRTRSWSSWSSASAALSRVSRRVSRRARSVGSGAISFARPPFEICDSVCKPGRRSRNRGLPRDFGSGPRWGQRKQSAYSCHNSAWRASTLARRVVSQFWSLGGYSILLNPSAEFAGEHLVGLLLELPILGRDDLLAVDDLGYSRLPEPPSF